MASSTEQPPSSSEPSSSSGILESTLSTSGEEIRVIHSTKFGIDEHIENLQVARRKAPFVPPSSGTPINALPNEILSWIFTLGSGAEEQGDDEDEDEDEDEEDSIDEHRQRLPFKVLVSQVCRSWRTVAIETSTLWTYFDFAECPPLEKSRTCRERLNGCFLKTEVNGTVSRES